MTVDTKHTQAFIGNGASVTGDGKTSGVSVKSGGFNTGFVADTPKASVSFDPVSNVNTTNDTIHIAGSGLSAGDYVTYHKGTGDSNQAIGGLQDGHNYYARNDGSDNISFYDTKAEALAGTSAPKVLVDPATQVDPEQRCPGWQSALVRQPLLQAWVARSQ